MIKEEISAKDIEVLFFSENSRKLIQTLSNANSIKILQLLETKDMSAGELAEKLDLSLNTIKYNLDSLLEVDLIRISDTKWSQRGRKIKIYELVEKILVFIPSYRKENEESILNLLWDVKEKNSVLERIDF